MSLYERMKARGVAMDWYERGRKHQTPGAIPLVDDACQRASVYLLRLDGSLWTVRNGEPYRKVRGGKAARDNEVYVCLHCKRQASTPDINHEEATRE